MSALCVIGLLVGYSAAWSVLFVSAYILTDRWLKR